MSEIAHFTDIDPSADPKRIGERLSIVAHHIRTEKPHTFHEEISKFLVEALLFLKIEKAQEVVARLERAVAEGNHDLVNAFLNDIAKMQHSEFAQEVLQDASRTRHVGPGLVLSHDLHKFGRQVLGLADDDQVVTE